LAAPGTLSADLWPAYPEDGDGRATCQVAVVSTEDVVDVTISRCDGDFAEATRTAASGWAGLALEMPSSYVASWLRLEKPDAALYATFDVIFKRSGTVRVKAGEAVRVRKASYLSKDEDWYCMAVVSTEADGRPARVDAEDDCPEAAVRLLGSWQWTPLEIAGQAQPYSVAVRIEGRQQPNQPLDTLDVDSAPHDPIGSYPFD